MATDLMSNVGGKFISALPDSFYRRLATEHEVPWGPVGYVTYKRTYAQRLDPHDVNSNTEEWIQTIRRVVNGILDIGGAFTLEEAEQLAYYMYTLKCLVSGRGMWQQGMPTVKRIGGDSLQACWHVPIDDPIKPFCFAFEELMLGGGVGFNIMPDKVYSLPKVAHRVEAENVETYDCDYIVPDNREGWVELLRKILKSAFFTGQPVRYNTDCVRPKGRPIKGFGGTASGPEDLVKGIRNITKILNLKVGRKLEPIDALDIMNIIGEIVVAGNVRRSAEIACGHPHDVKFLMAKMWSEGTIPGWRQNSNNTVVTDTMNELRPEFWKGYEIDPKTGSAYGEAYGLFNPYLSAHYGRLRDGFDYRPDYGICGPNPCGEIILDPYECCNLGEIFLPNLKDSEEFHKVATLLYKAQKTVSTLPFLHEDTNHIVRHHHRLGIGVTGFTAAHHLRSEEIFDSVYRHLEAEDREYSALLRVSESNKLTTVKPSGTLTKLADGCPPGANAAYARFHILRITFASDNPMVEKLIENGYEFEYKLNLDDTLNHNSMLFKFPMTYPAGTPTDAETTAMQQMDNIEWLQTHWADNAVSNTIQYKQSDLPAIKERLNARYQDCIKTISFSMHQHGWRQAPNEEITEEEYRVMKSRVKPITSFTTSYQDELMYSLECSDGGCPIR